MILKDGQYLYTIQDVAKLLTMPRAFYLVKSKQIPAPTIKHGRQCYYSDEDLMQIKEYWKKVSKLQSTPIPKQILDNEKPTGQNQSDIARTLQAKGFEPNQRLQRVQSLISMHKRLGLIPAPHSCTGHGTFWTDADAAHIVEYLINKYPHKIQLDGFEIIRGNN